MSSTANDYFENEVKNGDFIYLDLDSNQMKSRVRIRRTELVIAILIGVLYGWASVRYARDPAESR